MKITHPRETNVYTSILISSSLQENNSKGYYFTGFRASGIISKNTTASALIQSYFFSLKDNASSLLHSTPTYSHTSSKVTIHVFYFIGKKSYTKEKSAQEVMSSVSMSSLSNSLASIYKKEVSLVLTRIHYPYLNSCIFAKYLAHNAPSNTFVHFKNSILTYPSRNASLLPAYITGIKIELAGRLLTERVVPRMTKKISLFGSFSGPVDYAKYTTKNELGAFTIKVWIAQKIRR